MDMISTQFAYLKQRIKHLILLHVELIKKLLEFSNLLHALLITSIHLLRKTFIYFSIQ